MAEDNETYSLGKDEDGELTRRDMIKLGASAAIAVALTGLDGNAFAQAVQDKAPLFFRELKSRTARAYYTSEIGIKTEMEYKGNVSLKEFVGYDAT